MLLIFLSFHNLIVGMVIVIAVLNIVCGTVWTNACLPNFVEAKVKLFSCACIVMLTPLSIVLRAKRKDSYFHKDALRTWYFNFLVYTGGIITRILVILNHRPCRNSAVRRWLPTAAARVRVRAACGICGGQSRTGAGFLRVLRFPLPIIPPISPLS
jgi:hypothetical protein